MEPKPKPEYERKCVCARVCFMSSPAVIVTRNY